MKKFTQIKKTAKTARIDRIVEDTTNELRPEQKTDELVEVGQKDSNVVKFFSKLFESKEMAHVYHLQVKGEEGSYAAHKALEDYYEDMLELLDDTIEVYQGQYGVIEGYDIIDTDDTKDKDFVSYFEEIAEFVKVSKKCIPEEDTHTHSLIDDIVCLIYKTLYKLKFLK
jgi:hypothetical protein